LYQVFFYGGCVFSEGFTTCIHSSAFFFFFIFLVTLTTFAHRLHSISSQVSRRSTDSFDASFYQQAEAEDETTPPSLIVDSKFIHRLRCPLLLTPFSLCVAITLFRAISFNTPRQSFSVTFAPSSLLFFKDMALCPLLLPSLTPPFLHLSPNLSAYSFPPSMKIIFLIL
jgi:hypothetical protein